MLSIGPRIVAKNLDSVQAAPGGPLTIEDSDNFTPTQTGGFHHHSHMGAATNQN